MTESPDRTRTVRVVFADANVLYSRVLRDFLHYAADEEVIAVAWSASVGAAPPTNRRSPRSAGREHQPQLR